MNPAFCTNHKFTYLHTGEGRLRRAGETVRFDYTLKDLPIAIGIGNTRTMFTITDNHDIEPLQSNHYYPFGMRFNQSAAYTADTENRYLYNGKELQQDLGLDWYDYGARFYDAAIGRFTTIDPMAESYYGLTGYNYVGNNPIRRIDPDGRLMSEIWDIGGGENFEKYLRSFEQYSEYSGVIMADMFEDHFNEVSARNKINRKAEKKRFEEWKAAMVGTVEAGPLSSGEVLPSESGYSTHGFNDLNDIELVHGVHMYDFENGWELTRPAGKAVEFTTDFEKTFGSPVLLGSRDGGPFSITRIQTVAGNISGEVWNDVHEGRNRNPALIYFSYGYLKTSGSGKPIIKEAYGAFLREYRGAIIEINNN